MSRTERMKWLQTARRWATTGVERIRRRWETLQQMNPTAYIETSVVSYLTARSSRDVVVAAYQEVTREWWRDAAVRFRLVASELVLAEAGAGDPVAARDRLKVLEGITLLDASPDAEGLARRLQRFPMRR